MADEKLCSRCEDAPRRHKQRWCNDCHAAYIRENRRKKADGRSLSRLRAPWMSEMGRYGGVYFVRVQHFVKIGIATSVTARLAAIQTANPLKVDPLGWIRVATGNEAFRIEQALHRQFGPAHHRGEWFHDGPEIEAYIAAHAKPWPDVST